MLYSIFIYLLFHPHGTVDDMNMNVWLISGFCNFIFSWSVCGVRMNNEIQF